MINWLRKRVARLERRWIPDEGQRLRHDEHVRGRLDDPHAIEEGESERNDHVDDGRHAEPG